MATLPRNRRAATSRPSTLQVLKPQHCGSQMRAASWLHTRLTWRWCMGCSCRRGHPCWTDLRSLMKRRGVMKQGKRIMMLRATSLACALHAAPQQTAAYLADHPDTSLLPHLPGHASGPQSVGLATHCSTQVPPQLRAAQRKAVRLPHAMWPSWHTEVAHVTLPSKQPVGRRVVVVVVSPAALPLWLQRTAAGWIRRGREHAGKHHRASSVHSLDCSPSKAYLTVPPPVDPVPPLPCTCPLPIRPPALLPALPALLLPPAGELALGNKIPPPVVLPPPLPLPLLPPPPVPPPWAGAVVEAAVKPSPAAGPPGPGSAICKRGQVGNS